MVEKDLFGRRLLIRDSFKCHNTPRVKKLLLARHVDMAAVPVNAPNLFSQLMLVGTNRLKIGSVSFMTIGWKAERKPTQKAEV